MLIPAGVAGAVARICGVAVRSAEPVGAGVIAVDRWLVTMDDASTVFVKHGGGDMARWVASEVAFYEHHAGPSVCPFIGADRSPDGVTLVLPDLMTSSWPPPWTPAAVDAGFAALADVHAMRPAAGLPTAAAEPVGWPTWADATQAAPRVAAATGIPVRFLEDHVADLHQLAATARLDGDSLVHGDAHGGNLCVHEGRGVWVDWSEAQVGNPAQDDALLAISITADMGAVGAHPCDMPLVALFAGTWAARAGLPPPAWGPTVRAVERRLLLGALALLARAGLTGDI